ncbi:MAG: hypothetical protein ACO1QB_18785 [Verrucomicrobiales bacterium]
MLDPIIWIGNNMWWKNRSALTPQIVTRFSVRVGSEPKMKSLHGVAARPSPPLNSTDAGVAVI